MHLTCYFLLASLPSQFGKGVAQLDRRRNVCYADEYDCARAVEVQNYEFPPAMNDAIVSSRTTEHNYIPE